MSKTTQSMKPKPVKGSGRPRTRFKTYTVERAKAQFDRLLADAEAGCVIDITRRGRAIVSILSSDKLEMLEILANPDAMRAIRNSQKTEASGEESPERSANSKRRN